ncbi:hypothetical protein GOBAR_AA20464 [Gossypium barbadense]|uniref:MATH domain-containing protein n=1 Tax=Gossypium barbadense TaxID=3634 RepID=A0A2P5XA41_GOSBA|nr:hypothetical protein GOBAR_AA20464 [Gossypium barbadense]
MFGRQSSEMGFLADNVRIKHNPRINITCPPNQCLSLRTRIRRITRDFPPAHFLFKVEAFSLLAKTGVEKYESDAFEASGYKGDGAVKRFHWMKTEWGFAQLISLDSFNDTCNGYLVGDCCIFGAEVFPLARNCKWECLSMVKQPEDNTIILKMDHFSKLDRKYYESSVHTIGDSKWKLTVYPKGNVKFKGKALSVFLELLEANKLPPKRKVYAEYKLRVRNQMNDNHMEFSSLFENIELNLVSWFKNLPRRLSLYPNGDNKSNGNGFISLYLVIEETENLPLTWEVNVSFRLFVLDQIRDKYLTIEERWFSATSVNWGYPQFMTLKVLHDPSKGYIVCDSLIVEAEINLVSQVKRLS